MKNKIVLASANEGKAREFRAILEPLGFEIVLQSELGVVSPEETGRSFIENAILKARYAAEKTGMWALADDSGLAVDALNGAPGIYSARFSGGDDKSNNAKLLELMKNVPSKSVDTVFTSPPYNRKRNDKYSFYDDTIDNYFDFLCKFTDEALRVAKNHVIINIQKNYYNKVEVFKYIGKYAKNTFNYNNRKLQLRRHDRRRSRRF